MNQSRRNVPLGRSRELFPEGSHICLIYSEEDERRLEIGSYLALGLAEGEQVRYFADTTPPDEIHAWIQAMSLDVPPPPPRAAGAPASEAFEVFEARTVYCPSGTFVPDAMLRTLASCYDDAVKAGYAGARLSGEMTWALRGIPGSERLVEYEALINVLVELHPITAVCQYDARRFDGATILDVLRVHPMMIVHGQIVRNPYYTRPSEFLARHGASRQQGG